MNADTISRYDLAETVRALRRHVVSRADLSEILTALDQERVKCAPHGWRFDIERGPDGSIIAMIATPVYPVPQ